MASLAATFGRGAMTNGWTDIANADVILAMGGLFLVGLFLMPLVRGRASFMSR